MATKVKTGVIDSGAITSALITDASITADDLHTTLDLTGKTVTVATASASDNDTSVASTAYVTTAIANLADSAPSTLNTLNELAAALGDDANFSTTVTNSIATKLPLAGGTMTGDIAMGTNQIIFDNNSQAILIKDAAGTASYVLYQDNADTLILGNNTNVEKIRLDTNGNEGAVVVDSSGRVGIGTTGPGNTLDVQNSGDNIIQTTGVISGGVTALKLRQSRGSLSSPTNSSTNGDGNYIVSQIYRDAGYNSNAWIGLVTDANANDGRIIFGTASGGTIAEKMRIASDGAVTLKPNGITTGLRLQGRASDNNFFIQWNSNNGSTNYGSIGNNSGQSAGYYSFENHIFTNTSSGTTYMTIDSSGDVLIGNSTVQPVSQHNNQAGFGFDKSAGQLQIASTTNNAQLQLGRNSADDGNWITLRKQSNILGNIGTYGGAAYIGSTAGGLMFNGTDIEPTTGGSSRTSGTISLGSSNYLFNDGKFGGRLSATYINGNYDWGSSHAIFGQDRYRVRELNNLFYGAKYRWGSYGSSSSNLSHSMFNGNFDSGITLSTNTTHVFEIDTGGTYTYPAGAHYISFYHVYNQFQSIQIEQYHVAGTHSGQWVACGSPTDFRGSAGGGGRVVEIVGAGNNYTQKYRLTIVTNSNSVVLTDWAHFMTRSAGYDVNQFFKKDDEQVLTRNIIFRNDAVTQVGSIVVGSSSTAYNTTSDYRLKENVTPITSAADKVQQLNPIKFNFIEDETDTLIDGFLAHEVASVVPEAVSGEKDAVTPDELYEADDPIPEGASVGDVKVVGGKIVPQQLDYTKLIPILTAALQEALDRIEVLEKG